MFWESKHILWALFLVVIPILIHLFRFRKYKTIVFNRVDLLKSILVKKGFGNNLKKYLVLAFRTLAIASLVFAFALPFIPNAKKNQPYPNKECLIFLDNSLSMQQNAKEGVLFETAKNKAREVVKAMPSDFKFNLLSHNSIHAEFYEKEVMLKKIDDLKLSQSSLSLQEVETSLSKITTPNTTVIILSDFRLQIPLEFKTSLKANNYYWLPINTPPNTANIAIDTAWFFSPIFSPNQNNNLEIKIKNYSESIVESLPIKIIENNSTIGVVNSSIGPNSSVTVSYNYKSTDTGWKELKIQIPNDEFNFDDSYYLTFYIKTGNKGVVVSEQKNDVNKSWPALLSSENGFLTNFEDPLSLSSDKIKFSDFIILDGVSSLSSGLQNDLQNFVKFGGNLMVFPNNLGNNNALNSLLGSLNSVYFKELISPAVTDGLELWNLNYPPLKGVFEKVPKNIDLPLVTKYYSLSSNSSFWKFKNGNPFFLQNTFGEGNVFLCVSPLSIEFTNLQKHPLFVPLILKLTSYKSYNQISSYLIQNIEPIILSSVNFNSSSIYTVQKNSQSFVPNISKRGDETLLYLSEEFDEPSIYNILNNNYLVYKLALNRNREESNTKGLDNEQLNKMAEENNILLNASNAEAIANKISLDIKGKEYWQFFLILAVVFLLVEMILIKLWK